MKRILFALISVVASLTSCERIILDGGWFHVLVPDKGKSNTIIITVDF